MNWTEEESWRARQLYGEGKSLSQIAVILNSELHQDAPVRRSNMVMGRIHRLRAKGATIRTPNTHPAHHVAKLTDAQRKQRIRDLANAAAKRRRAAKRKTKPAAPAVIDFALYRPRLSITDRESIPLELRAEPWHPLRDAKPAFLLRGRTWVR